MAIITGAPTWTITVAGDIVSFDYTGSDRYSVPRVWAGRGLGITQADLPEFVQALAKVPDYESLVPSQDDRAEGNEPTWSKPRYDPDEAFVYVTGPCQLPVPLPGYAPTSTFTIKLRHVAALRARLTAYLR
ncbi:hypothetical protein [Kibdelosporangium aridum]|uniref:Uncharacterized protein n=1 Tax=Kibdelosporangium aridum TaxID=2030 RepID=A0A1W2FXD6_KIBAR|nr:hypothetical protein [Kibdelosporangium aridum]SMD26551.1 hypothetical protein SAMN05661093_10134 [Kibdelosporangium aridum]